MNVGEVFEGAGLCAWGIAFYGLALWLVGSDDRMRRMAESRWWLDRHITGKVRRGERSKNEHFDSWIKGQRFLVKWIFTPFLAVWEIACIALFVQGLMSH